MPHEHVAARTALVLETNNLRGGAGLDAAGASLLHVIGLLAQQSVALSALAQVVVTHDGLCERIRTSAERVAGRGIDFVRINAGTGYYQAKNDGFDAVHADRCDYVCFADADCEPEQDWIEQLIAPLTDAAPPAVVAGRTSYVTLDLSPGYGYTGIVIAMLAGLHPLGVVAAGVFVAGVLVGADTMSRAVGVPTYIADVIVAASLIAVLVATLLTQFRVRLR